MSWFTVIIIGILCLSPVLFFLSARNAQREMDREVKHLADIMKQIPVEQPLIRIVRRMAGLYKTNITPDDLMNIAHYLLYHDGVLPDNLDTKEKLNADYEEFLSK